MFCFPEAFLINASVQVHGLHSETMGSNDGQQRPRGNWEDHDEMHAIAFHASRHSQGGQIEEGSPTASGLPDPQVLGRTSWRRLAEPPRFEISMTPVR